MRLAGASGRFWNTHLRNLSVPLTTAIGVALHLSIQVLFSFLSGQFEMLDSKRVGPIHVGRERERGREGERKRGRKKERERERGRERGGRGGERGRERERGRKRERERGGGEREKEREGERGRERERGREINVHVHTS